MFWINRLKTVIKTAEGNFGNDQRFFKGINLIASNTNTEGKSSCIEAIYYCLGLEEILGGRNDKALKPVFKSKIDYNGNTYVPIETNIYLEIQNDMSKIITINRNVEKQQEHNLIIKVYDGNIEETLEGKCNLSEYYIHSSGSATSQKGFHAFLEKFIGWKLPEVPTYDDKDRKLYLQTIFPAMFIEQKRGWSGLLNTIPNFGVKDVKRKVIEYILNLDIIENERLKIEQKIKEVEIKNKWTIIVNEINSILKNKCCTIPNLYENPKVLDENNMKMLSIFKQEQKENIYIEKYIEQLETESDKLKQKDLKVGTNIEELQIELDNLKKDILQDEEILETQNKQIHLEEDEIKAIMSNLEIINKDLTNNKDLRKLKQLGALKNTNIINDICPTCNQKIKDCLLPQVNNFNVMSIEENIKHLQEQKNLLEYSINAHKDNIKKYNELAGVMKETIIKKRRIIRNIINDIYLTDTSIAETYVYKKVAIDNEIDELQKLITLIETYKKELLNLSKEWEKLLEVRNKIPKDSFSENDNMKIKKLRDDFINFIKNYRYSSIDNLSEIEISKEKLLPSVYGFDLTADCSASDNIRVIWAFTLALLINSLALNGNHPNVLIIDEPDQQSIVAEDLYKFLEDLYKLNDKSQIILGITLKDEELKKFVNKLENINILLIEDKAMKPI